MGACPCQKCCESADRGSYFGDEPVVPIFGDDFEALSMPPVVPSRSVHDLSPSTPTSRASKTPKISPRISHVEVCSEDGASSRMEKQDPVVMEAEFDFYDPLSKRAQVMPLVAEVQHHRPGARQHFSNNPADFGHQLLAPPDFQPSEALTPKSRARNEVEVVTRWGVLSGKLIFSKVLTLTTMSSIFVVRAQQVRLEKNSRVWRRIEARARRAVSQAASLAARVVKERSDMYHGEWRCSEGGALSELFTSEYVDTLMILAKASAKLLALQPVLAEANVPCRIFGDIHGQLRDLLLFFAAFGFPGSTEDSADDEMSYVFNGDFVDRGAHSLEVIGILLALKVSMPDRVWLVRGNHEDRTMNARYGFLEECELRLGNNFGRKTYDLLQNAFDQLPLACVVGGKILCVHGGVGDGRWDLNDLRALRRPLGQQELGCAKLRWVNNILWSDPIEDDREERSQEESGPVFGVHESPRNTTAVLFGWDVTKTFCARNGLAMVVRSHQSKKNGHGFDLMHDETLVRVFSARDYEGHCNDGAVLLVRPGEGSLGCERPSFMSVRAQVLGSYAKAQGLVA
ncbi:unnamed protein product [Durusdinium trenchii]|uniref:Serine/threonine-protein phosphatase n=1 Tax=Durusdinium trenchii TaxID=1381693 RepID=A0ABP0JMJ2_9DINO